MTELQVAVERGFISELERAAIEAINALYIGGEITDEQYESALVALGLAVSDEV